MKRLSILLIMVALCSACNLGIDTRGTSANFITPAATKTLTSSDVNPTTQAVVNNASSVAPTSAITLCTVRSEWPTYTVQRGDNLTLIATRTNSTPDELVDANCLENPNALSVGQVLHVPRLPVTPVPATSAETITFTHDGLAFDYPATWIYTQYTGGAGNAGFIGTFKPQDAPPTASKWPDDFLGVGFSTISSDLAKATVIAGVEEARQTAIDSGRYTVSEAKSFTLPSGISGLMFETRGPGPQTEHYHFIYDDQYFIFEVQGNYNIARPVFETLRPES